MNWNWQYFKPDGVRHHWMRIYHEDHLCVVQSLRCGDWLFVAMVDNKPVGVNPHHSIDEAQASCVEALGIKESVRHYWW